MKILFIGGTGRLSNDIAKLSVDKNYDVYLITRGTSSRKKFVDSRYKMIYCDINNREEIINKISGLFFDVIIDFLTFSTEQLSYKLDLFDGMYKQYIFISTATVYDKKNEQEVITESNTKIGNQKWAYAYKKYLCEEYLKKFFKNKKDEYYTIVRPYVTYNKTRIPYPIVPQNSSYEYSLIRRIKNGKEIPTIMKGNIQTTITNTKDFAKGVVGLFNNEKAKYEAFHITSEEKVTWRSVLDLASNYYGKSLTIVDFSIEDFSKKFPIYEEILNGDKGHSMIFDNSKIKKVVKEFKCNISLQQGIKETLDFYEENIEYQKRDYYWEGRIDKICKSNIEREFPNFKAKLKYFIGYSPILNSIYNKTKK